ncbi:MAG: hypothetical protein PVS3B3_32390 [Ktedonobacteraceae bacterium]
MSDRDTQFAGFAELLLAEIADPDEWKLADVEKLVTQRAYDFAYHVLYCNGIDSSCWNGRASDIYKRETISKVNALPDMIGWSNEQS